MKAKKNSKRAISTVITTIIIMVASVVLSSGVVVYGTSLFQGGTQSESISVQGVKLWVDPTDANGLAWGAAGIRNSGDQIVSVDLIQVRGSDVPFRNWYADTDQTRVNVANYQAKFIHTGSYDGISGKMSNSDPDADCGAAFDLEIDQDGIGGESALCMTQASGPLSLDPGERMVIYFQVQNATLSSLDSGIATSTNIFAGNTGAPLTIVIGNP